jgi:hypothetical protein
VRSIHKCTNQAIAPAPGDRPIVVDYYVEDTSTGGRWDELRFDGFSEARLDDLRFSARCKSPLAVSAAMALTAGSLALAGDVWPENLANKVPTTEFDRPRVGLSARRGGTSTCSDRSAGTVDDIVEVAVVSGGGVVCSPMASAVGVSFCGRSERRFDTFTLLRFDFLSMTLGSRTGTKRELRRRKCFFRVFKKSRAPMRTGKNSVRSMNATRKKKIMLLYGALRQGSGRRKSPKKGNQAKKGDSWAGRILDAE